MANSESRITNPYRSQTIFGAFPNGGVGWLTSTFFLVRRLRIGDWDCRL